MRTFVLCMLISALMIGTYAEFASSSQVDAVVNMGLLYAQNTFNIDPQCIVVLQKAFDVAQKVIAAISEGKNDDLFAIIMQAIPLINDFQAHCLNN